MQPVFAAEVVAVDFEVVAVVDLVVLAVVDCVVVDFVVLEVAGLVVLAVVDETDVAVVARLFRPPAVTVTVTVVFSTVLLIFLTLAQTWTQRVESFGVELT